MHSIDKHTAVNALGAVQHISIQQHPAAYALMDSKSSIQVDALLESSKACIHQGKTALTLRGIRAQIDRAQVLIGHC